LCWIRTQLPSPKGIFGPCLLRPNGCMDQLVRSRPPLRRHCVRWGSTQLPSPIFGFVMNKDPAPLPKGEHSPQFSAHFWATVCKTVRPMLSDRCLSVCLPVCLSVRPPANFNRFRVLASLLHRRRSLEANQTLHGVWPSAGLVHSHTVYTFSGAFAPTAILLDAKFTLRPSLALPYVGSVTELHSSSGHQRNFAAWIGLQGMEILNAGGAEDATCIRQDGHHVGHRPTF